MDWDFVAGNMGSFYWSVRYEMLLQCNAMQKKKKKIST